jgi:hypothetical protein
MTDAHQEADTGEQIAPIGAVGIMAPLYPTRDFNKALELLAPGAGATALATQIFGGNATRFAVIGWRKGRHRPPAWARELVIARLYNLAAEYQAAANQLRTLASHDAVATAARARKEKARQQGGP